MDKIIELAEELIRIPSTKDNLAAQQEIIDRSKTLLKEFTLTPFNKDGVPSLLASNTNPGTKEFKVILNAHLDVVPANDEQFNPYEKSGKLYGRGAMDMKAAGAVMMLVFKELAHKVSYPLALQLVTDEEIGGFNGAKHQIDDGTRADFVIAGEPTEFGINCEAKGIIWATITTKGVSAHGARPWEGVNAIDRMAKILAQITKAYPTPKEEAWKTTINIAKIETSNQAFNKLPSDCTVSLDIRYLPEDKEAVKKFLRNTAKGSELKLLLEEPAQFTPEDDPYIAKLQKAITDILGTKPYFVKKHGGSDVRHYNQLGIAAITFGPTGEGMHMDTESVDIRSLEQYYQILQSFLLAVDSK